MNMLILLGALCVAVSAQIGSAPGGLTEAKDATDEVKQLMAEFVGQAPKYLATRLDIISWTNNPTKSGIDPLVRSDVEEWLSLELPFPMFEAVTYKTQVVQGIMYFVKVHVDIGSFVHVKVWKKLQGASEVLDVQKDKSLADPLEYF